MISQQTRKILEYDRVLEMISGYAVSEEGKARVLSIVPVDDLQFIEDEFNRLSEMISITTGEANFRPPETPVLAEQVARLTKPGVVLEEGEIVLFGKLLEGAGQVRSYILRREDSLPMLSLLAGQLEPFENLHREINRVFDENNEVRSSASPVLSKLRKDSRAVRERIEKKLHDITERLAEEGSVGENFVTLRQERYVLAILRSEMHSCPGIIQGESASGNTLFIEPEQVVHLNNRLREIELDIRREIHRILAGLSAGLEQNREQLKVNIDILARIDSLYARARYAHEYSCFRPAVNREGEFLLKKARHPLLISREVQHAQPVVPLDLHLEQKERTLLVSGPNAGGKTVLLKTVGLVSLMAQSGIFPPLNEGSSLPVFEAVITAIGDEQSIDKDLSTFSGHVWDLKQALENGMPRSLVLLDEVGVGTDPAEGAALASAVLERLTRLGCLTLCTTHYGELKLLFELIPGLVNGSLEFDTEKMKPAFIFRKGIPGQSYGLAIAKNIGLDQSVLARAEEYMTGAVVNINQYIARLEDQQKKLTRQLEAVEAERAEIERRARALEDEKGLLDQRADELEELEKSFEDRMSERLRQELLQARKEVEGVIARLEREYAERENAREAARTARSAIENRIREMKHPSSAPDAREIAAEKRAEPISVGDRVKVAHLALEGEVVDGPDRSGKYTVVAGRARMSITGEELRKIGRRKSRQQRVAFDLSSIGSDSDTAEVSNKLDLRGMRADEIGQELDRFLSGAVMSGLTQVLVVHGKGTGALRAKVAELLTEDKRVESFHPGAWNEGGIGATVVSLAH